LLYCAGAPLRRESAVDVLFCAFVVGVEEYATEYVAMIRPAHTRTYKNRSPRELKRRARGTKSAPAAFMLSSEGAKRKYRDAAFALVFFISCFVCLFPSLLSGEMRVRSR